MDKKIAILKSYSILMCMVNLLINYIINAHNYTEDKQKPKHNMCNHIFTTANYFNRLISRQGRQVDRVDRSTG